jgi:hypothetical protein
MSGRSVDPFGRPTDGGAPLPSGDREPLWPRPPSLLGPVVRRRATLGLLALDVRGTFRFGDTVLAVGGTPPVVRHMVAHQAFLGRVCIHARCAPAHGVRRYLPSEVTVEAPSGGSDAGRWLVPWAALAIGEWMRRRGRDAIVVLDSLEAFRRAAAAFGQRGAWTTQLGQIASRAYATHAASLSVVVLADRAIAGALDAVDGVVDLDRAAGGDPVPHSSKILRPSCRLAIALVGSAVAALGCLAELEASAPWAVAERARLDPQVRMAQRARICMQHGPGVSLDPVEQWLALVAILRREVPLDEVAALRDRLTAHLRAEQTELVAHVRRGQDREDLLAALDRIAAELHAGTPRMR